MVDPSLEENFCFGELLDDLIRSADSSHHSHPPPFLILTLISYLDQFLGGRSLSVGFLSATVMMSFVWRVRGGRLLLTFSSLSLLLSLASIVSLHVGVGVVLALLFLGVEPRSIENYWVKEPPSSALF